MVKIGMTKDSAERRVANLNTGDPHGAYYVVHSINVADALAVERELHEDFRMYRASGEWFAISQGAAITALNDVAVSQSIHRGSE
jgi:hypothetical protein